MQNNSIIPFMAMLVQNSFICLWD